MKFPVNNPDQYVKVAISVIPDGLSPDTVYFVPITIKNVTNYYEVNSEKTDMLYRVLLKNYYAEQLPNTYYQAKVGIFDNNGNVVSMISTTKPVRPLSKNSVRTYVANEVQTNKSTVEEINKYSIVLTVKTPATQTTPAVYDNWITVDESLKRQDN